MYPFLGELIREYHKRGFTTFLVTNGTNPRVLAQLEEEPTQLYVSLYATDAKGLARLCRPRIAGAWKRISETLGLLSSFNCPTVIRITLVRGFNMDDVEGYARELAWFDGWLAGFTADWNPADLLLLTADHGNDPTTASTDHSREYVPLLAFTGSGPGRDLGTRSSFADVGATALEAFRVNQPAGIAGTSFYANIA